MATSQAFDSLPYIDADITPRERETILARLNADIAAEARTTEHPSLAPLITPRFSPLITAELQRVEAQGKLKAIDASRYEVLDTPESGDGAAAWRDALRRAYAADAYLRNRRENLQLLEERGKNAWLIGNYHLEHQLKAIEKELVDSREAIDAINRERKQAQQDSHAELESLDQSWRKGVGRILEIEVASEQLRQEALEARRSGATG